MTPAVKHRAGRDPAGRRRAGDRRLDAVLAALADPVRRRLLDLLAEQGPASASRLCGSFAISRQGVAKHLAVLEAAGLVAVERVGREARYRAVVEPASEAAAWLTSRTEAWDRRLVRLRQAATRSRPRG